MHINADKPQLWKADTRASVDQFNQWFMKFAPKAYRDTRKKTIEIVAVGLTLTNTGPKCQSSQLPHFQRRSERDSSVTRGRVFRMHARL